MASPSPDVTPAGAAPLPGVDGVASGLRTRRSSPLSPVGGRLRPAIGAVGRSAGRLGLTFGLPGSLRRRAMVGGADLGEFPVRPPDYWTGHEPDEEELSEERQAVLAPTGDAAWDRVITAVRAKARAQRTVKAAVTSGQRARGLPSTVHRKGTSVVGPMTAPGSVARRMAVATVAPPPNPATAPNAPAARSTSSAASAPAARTRPRTTTRATVRQPASFPTASDAGSPDDFSRAKEMLRKLRGEEPPVASAPDDVRRAPADPTPVTPGARRATASESAHWASPEAASAAAAATAGHWAVPTTSPVRDTAGRVLRRMRGDIPTAAAPATPARPVARPAAAPAPGAARTDAAPAVVEGARTGRTAPTGQADAAPPVERAGDAHPTPAAPTAVAGAPAATASSTGPAERPAAGHLAAALADAASPAARGTVPTEVATTPAGLPAAPPRWWPADATVAGTAAAAPPAHAARTAVQRTPGRTFTAGARPLPTAGPSAALVQAGLVHGSSDGPGELRRTALGVEWVTEEAPLDVSPAALPVAAPAMVRTVASAQDPADAARPAGAPVTATAEPGRPLAPTATPAPTTVRRTPSAAWPGRLFAGGPTLGPAVTTGHAIVRRLTRLVHADAAATTAAASAALPAAPPAVVADRRPAAGSGATVRRSRATSVVTPGTSVAGRTLGARSIAQQLPGGFVHGVAAGTIDSLAPVVDAADDVVHRAAMPEMAPAAVVVRPHAEPDAPRAGAGATAQRAPLRLVHDATNPATAAMGPVPTSMRPATTPPTATTAAKTKPGATAARRSTPAAATGTAIVDAPAIGGDTTTGTPAPTSPPADPAVHVAVAAGLQTAQRAFEPVVPEPELALARLASAPPALVAQAVASVTPEDGARLVGRQGAAMAVADHQPVAVARRTPIAHEADVAVASAAAVTPATRRPGMVLRTPDEVRRAAEATFTPVAATPPAGDTPRAKVERFQQIMREAGPISVTPLPAAFRPLAEEIVGDRPVHISTGEASRRALASVGTDAAVTGNVVHLQRTLDTSPESLSVLAHELTHVAAASAVPRFHGGVASPEERRADTAEHAVARAAKAVAGGRDRAPRSAGVAGLPVGSPMVVQRREKTDDIVQRVTERISGSSAPAIQRQAGPAPAPPRSAWTAPGYEDGASGGGGDATIRRSPATIVQRKGGPEGGGEPAGTGVVGSDGEISEAMLAKIVRAVEDRLLEEIERRGGLWRGGF